MLSITAQMLIAQIITAESDAAWIAATQRFDSHVAQLRDRDLDKMADAAEAHLAHMSALA